MRRLRYLLRETLANIRLNRTTTVIAVGTTAFTLACFGAFLLLYFNLKDLVSSLQDEVQVVLYLQDDVSPVHILNLQEKLKKEPEVSHVQFMSKQEALQDFKKQFPSESDLLEGLGKNPLPASLTVTIAEPFRSPEAVQRWADRQKIVVGIEQVQYSRDWVETLETFIGFLELAAVAVGGLLAVASITIIANTIKLTLYARREEIEILGLIGATNAFIKIPYLLEGAILGAIGGGLSVVILKGSFEFFISQFGGTSHFLGLNSHFGFLPLQISLFVVLAGLLLGSTGSLISLLQLKRTRA